MNCFKHQKRLGIGLVPITLSFALLSVIGCASIFTYWMTVSPWTGLIRCIGFVAIMGGVHFVGFRLWRRQLETNENRGQDQEIDSVRSNNVPHGLLWLIVAFMLFLLLWSLVL